MAKLKEEAKKLEKKTAIEVKQKDTEVAILQEKVRKAEEEPNNRKQECTVNVKSKFECEILPSLVTINPTTNPNLQDNTQWMNKRMNKRKNKQTNEWTNR